MATSCCDIFSHFISQRKTAQGILTRRAAIDSHNRQKSKSKSQKLNDAHGYRWLAQTMNFAGKPEEAMRLAEKAIRIDPRNQDWYLIHIGWACFLIKRYEETLTTLKKVVARYPNHLGAYSFLACTYSELGDEQKAQAAAREVLRISPNFSLEGLKQQMPYKDPAVLERFVAALRKAGLK
jgi:adenylate cyclase